MPRDVYKILTSQRMLATEADEGPPEPCTPFGEVLPDTPERSLLGSADVGETERYSACRRRREEEDRASGLDLMVLMVMGMDLEALSREVERLEKRASGTIEESDELRHKAEDVCPSALTLHLGKPLPGTISDDSVVESGGVFATYMSDDTFWLSCVEEAARVLRGVRLVQENPSFEYQKRGDALAATGFHELTALAKALRPDAEVRLEDMPRDDFWRLMRDLRARGGFDECVEAACALYAGENQPAKQTVITSFADAEDPGEISIDDLCSDPRAKLFAYIKSHLASLRPLSRAYYGFKDGLDGRLERAKTWAVNQLRMRSLKSRPVVTSRRPYRA